MYEKAVAYFERAAQIQPQEVKWKLMVASCHRRSGDYQLAFEIYRLIHADFPDNIECLRYLVHICDDLGKKDQVHEYVVKLRKAERAQEQMGPPGAQTQMGAPAEHRGPHEHGGGMPYGGDEENLPHNRGGQYVPGESAYENSQVMAAAAAGKSAGMPAKMVSAANADDDHFADVELDDAMLPH